MLSPATYAVRVHLIDSDGRKASTTSYTPFALGFDFAKAWAFTIAANITAISDATLYKMDISAKFKPDSVGEPGPESDVQRVGWLFYRNESGIYEAKAIPSIGRQFVEGEGPFAGVKLVEPTSTLGFDLLVLANALAATTTIEGEPWPPEYAGGAVLK